MTKSDLVRELVDLKGISYRNAEIIINVIFDGMSDELAADRRIEIRGFGSFVNRRYKAREARNSRTGEKISIKSKKLAFFKVGKELKCRIASVPVS